VGDNDDESGRNVPKGGVVGFVWLSFFQFVYGRSSTFTASSNHVSDRTVWFPILCMVMVGTYENERDYYSRCP
jgi:hypothetical protein